MLSKRIISEIKSLQLLKFRKQTALFVIEGEKVVKELLDSDFKIKLIAGVPDFFKSIDPSKLPDEIYELSDEELAKVSGFASANKVVAVAEIPKLSLPAYSDLTGPVLMLDGIKDPGNMGTIIRTAEWFGVKSIICSDDCVDCFNPKVVQSAMGSLFRIPVFYGTLPVMINEIKQEGKLKFVAATLEGKSAMTKFQPSQLALLIGSESHGISKTILENIDFEVTIPASGNSKAESLNAAVACGILLQSLQK